MLDYEVAAEEAAASNPDGWAIDPEAVLATEEHLWETEHFHGPEAALEEARRMWRVYMARFRAGERGEVPGMLVALSKIGAQYAQKAVA